jgi:hypothetical protein
VEAEALCQPTSISWVCPQVLSFPFPGQLNWTLFLPRIRLSNKADLCPCTRGWLSKAMVGLLQVRIRHQPDQDLSPFQTAWKGSSWFSWFIPLPRAALIILLISSPQMATCPAILEPPRITSFILQSIAPNKWSYQLSDVMSLSVLLFLRAG